MFKNKQLDRIEKKFDEVAAMDEAFIAELLEEVRATRTSLNNLFEMYVAQTFAKTVSPAKKRGRKPKYKTEKERKAAKAAYMKHYHWKKKAAKDLLAAGRKTK